MAKRKAKAATTVKKVSRGAQKMKRQAVKNLKAVATKARRRGKVAKKAAGKASRRAKRIKKVLG